MTLELGICQADGTGWEALASMSCGTTGGRSLAPDCDHTLLGKKGIASIKDSMNGTCSDSNVG